MLSLSTKPHPDVLLRARIEKAWLQDLTHRNSAEEVDPLVSALPRYERTFHLEQLQEHAISSGQLYTWRQQVLGGQMTLLSRTTPDFAQVEMTSAPPPPDEADAKNSTPVTPQRPAGLIEIMLPSGVTLRVDAEVDAAALGRVLAALGAR